MEKLRHFDTFSGYGGFTISAQKLGWETVGFSEVDKYANAVLEYNFSGIKNYGDITKIKGEDLPTIDIITGGSPCQDLSVAGKGAGLNGARSGLFFHFIRLIKEKQPTYFIWENVKGALSSSKGWDFAAVQIEMEQAGYDVWWQVLNAKDFGVPQNRERIFAIGIRKGSGREILFEQRESKQNLKSVVSGYSQSDRIYDADGVSASISAGENGGGKRPGGFYRVNKIVEQGAKTGLYAVPNSNGNVHSLDANYWKGSNNPNKSRRSQIMVGSTQKHAAKIEDISPALTKAMGDGGGHIPMKIEDMRIRRLTPTECERLMGLEDGWTAKGIIDGKEVDISDTQRYKMCGNGVVVNCVDYIYNLIKDNK